jgi:hypothetical protein
MKIISIKDLTEVPRTYTGIVEYSDGTKGWFLNGMWHREDGPAIEWANSKEWYLNGHIIFIEYSEEFLHDLDQFILGFQWLPNGKNLTKRLFFNSPPFDTWLLIEKDIKHIIPPFKEPFLFKKYLSPDGILFFPQQTFEETE